MTQGRVDLGVPAVGRPTQAVPASVHYLLDLPDDGRAFALSVFDLGLACCAVEFTAAALAFPDVFVPASASEAPDPGRTQVLVVSGTVTDKMAPAVRRCYEQLPEPRVVVSFGSCANSGGPYWDSYCVTKGVDQILPVDVYVPGCPPRPEALVQGLAVLRQKLLGGAG